VFKPISGLMASRFTTSSSTPRLVTDAPDATRTAESAKDEDPAEKAAKMGMYGPLTRSRLPFYPSRLLCKRFNVRPPANVTVDPGGEAESSKHDVVSQASLDRMMREASFKPVSSFIPGGVEGGREAAHEGGKAQPVEVNVERNEAMEGQRAGEAVFKAIFGSDDEDE